MDDLLTILTAMADSRAKAESPRDLVREAIIGATKLP